MSNQHDKILTEFELTKLAGRWKSNLVYKNLKKMNRFSSDNTILINQIWVIGDGEGEIPDTYNILRRMKIEAELDNRRKVYMHSNYEVTQFMCPPVSLNKSPIVRICKALVEAIHIKKGILSKYIIVMTGRKLVELFKNADRATNWLFNKFRRLLWAHLDQLPRKSKAKTIPAILVMKALPVPNWTDRDETYTYRKRKLTKAMV